MRVYIALLHYPVYNKNKDVVTTCITGFDLHDIARSAETFGVKKYFVVNPLPTQKAFAERILSAWRKEEAVEVNWTRAEAFKRVEVKLNLDEVIEMIEKKEGQKPKIIVTSAKAKNGMKFKELNEDIKKDQEPYLILFGTGWGLTEEAVGKADAVLEAIQGPSDYNHLSVRSAVAIILSKILV